MSLKPHLIVHCIVFLVLLSTSVALFLSGSVQFVLGDSPTFIPLILALFSATFGIYKTARYKHNIDAGCEITVTTAEAKIFPYLLYFVCGVLALMRFLK